jgi:phosphohistidine phosphatase
MKQLLIIRHAKSSWDITTPKDFDRELNDRGHKDAPEMAKRLVKKGIEIDAFISSTAVRAFTTAVYFAEVYEKAGYKSLDILGVPELYHAEPKTFKEVISNVDDAFKTIAVFSHNPGITEFVNGLTTTRIDDMPTCGIFAVKIETTTWKDFVKADKSFWFFDYPKNK